MRAALLVGGFVLVFLIAALVRLVGRMAMMFLWLFRPVRHQTSPCFQRLRGGSRSD